MSMGSGETSKETDKGPSARVRAFGEVLGERAVRHPRGNHDGQRATIVHAPERQDIGMMGSTPRANFALANAQFDPVKKGTKQPLGQHWTRCVGISERPRPVDRRRERLASGLVRQQRRRVASRRPGCGSLNLCRALHVEWARWEELERHVSAP